MKEYNCVIAFLLLNCLIYSKISDTRNLKGNFKKDIEDYLGWPDWTCSDCKSGSSIITRTCKEKAICGNNVQEEYCDNICFKRRLV